MDSPATLACADCTWSASLTQPQLLSTVDDLKQSKIKRITIQIGFEKEHQLTDFLKIYKQQSQGTIYQKSIPSRHGLHLNASKFNVVNVSFGHPSLPSIFCEVYSNELTKLEQIHECTMAACHDRLKIYFKDSPSDMLQNKIAQMKSRLVIYEKRGVINRILYCQEEKQLVEDGIKFRIIHKSRDRLVIFYSITKTFNEISQAVKKIFDREVHYLPIGLPTYNLSNSFKAYVYPSIEAKLKEYEIKLHYSVKYSMLAVYYAHPCFLDQALRQIYNILDEWVCASFERQEMRAVGNAIQKRGFQNTVIVYGKKEIYFLINKRQSDITNMMKVFKELMQKPRKMTVLLSFYSIENRLKLAQHLMKTTGDYSVNIENFEQIIAKKENELIILPHLSGEDCQAVINAEYLNILRQLLGLPVQPIAIELQNANEKAKSQKVNVKKHADTSHSLSKQSCDQPKEMNKEQSKGITQLDKQNNSSSLNAPTLQSASDQSPLIQRGQRKRKLEQQLNKQFGKQFKVYSIAFSDKIKMDAQCDSNEKQMMFKRGTDLYSFQRQGLALLNAETIIKENVKPNDELLGGYLSKDGKTFIPALWIKCL